MQNIDYKQRNVSVTQNILGFKIISFLKLTHFIT